MNNELEMATLAGGCFWCTEAIFKRLRGVTKVTPGYTGGKVTNPSYEAVCSGTTGHAEAVEISFDPNMIDFQTLLKIFFAVHDPTTLNKQGNDVGTQYRSAIFYHNEAQRQTAMAAVAKVEKAVTEVVAASQFYPAETYHLDYYDNNRSNPYCQRIIDPKIQKLLTKFQTYV